MQSDDKAIIFAGRKSTADHISSEFAMEGTSVQCLHGDREQSDREQALKDLKTGEVRILIATGKYSLCAKCRRKLSCELCYVVVQNSAKFDKSFCTVIEYAAMQRKCGKN